MNELNHLIQNGFNFYEKHFNVEGKCFLCDAPARSFLKDITSQAGYNSRERCCVPGTYEGCVVMMKLNILREVKKYLNNLGMTTIRIFFHH